LPGGFYNISQPNFAILLILVYALSSCGDLLASRCLVLKLVYNGNCVLIKINPNLDSLINEKMRYYIGHQVKDNISLGHFSGNTDWSNVTIKVTTYFLNEELQI
jgi:hypothetical protein